MNYRKVRNMWYFIKFVGLNFNLMIVFRMASTKHTQYDISACSIGSVYILNRQMHLPEEIHLRSGDLYHIHHRAFFMLVSGILLEENGRHLQRKAQYLPLHIQLFSLIAWYKFLVQTWAKKLSLKTLLPMLRWHVDNHIFAIYRGPFLQRIYHTKVSFFYLGLNKFFFEISTIEI